MRNKEVKGAFRNWLSKKHAMWCQHWGFTKMVTPKMNSCYIYKLLVYLLHWTCAFLCYQFILPPFSILPFKVYLCVWLIKILLFFFFLSFLVALLRLLLFSNMESTLGDVWVLLRRMYWVPCSCMPTMSIWIHLQLNPGLLCWLSVCFSFLLLKASVEIPCHYYTAISLSLQWTVSLYIFGMPHAFTIVLSSCWILSFKRWWI